MLFLFSQFTGRGQVRKSRIWDWPSIACRDGEFAPVGDTRAGLLHHLPELQIGDRRRIEAQFFKYLRGGLAGYRTQVSDFAGCFG